MENILYLQLPNCHKPINARADGCGGRLCGKGIAAEGQCCHHLPYSCCNIEDTCYQQ